jgi:hypothetical protein
MAMLRNCAVADVFQAEQFSVREIIEAKSPEPGGGSIWSAAE